MHKCTHWLVYKRVQLHFMTKSGAILGKGQFKKNGEKYLESSPFLASLDRTSVHGHSLRVLIKRAFSTSPLPINFAFDRSQIKILQWFSLHWNLQIQGVPVALSKKFAIPVLGNPSKTLQEVCHQPNPQTREIPFSKSLKFTQSLCPECLFWPEQILLHWRKVKSLGQGKYPISCNQGTGGILHCRSYKRV